MTSALGQNLLENVDLRFSRSAGMWALWLDANLRPSCKFSRLTGHFRLGGWVVVPVWDLLSTVQGKGFPLCALGGGVVSPGKWVCSPALGTPERGLVFVAIDSLARTAGPLVGPGGGPASADHHGGARCGICGSRSGWGPPAPAEDGPTPGTSCSHVPWRDVRPLQAPLGT